MNILMQHNAERMLNAWLTEKRCTLPPGDRLVGKRQFEGLFTLVIKRCEWVVSSYPNSFSKTFL